MLIKAIHKDVTTFIYNILKKIILNCKLITVLKCQQWNNTNGAELKIINIRF